MGNAASLAELMNNMLFCEERLHLEEGVADDLTRVVAVLAGVVNDSTLHDDSNINTDDNIMHSDMLARVGMVLERW